MFDEEPDRDPHGECRAEITRLTAELAAARSVAVDVCQYLDCPAPNLLAVVTSLYESRVAAVDALAASRAVPADVEALIKEVTDGALEAGSCSALGHTYSLTKDPTWTVPRLKAAIARAISEARAAAPSAVGGLTIDEARAVGIAGVRAAIGEVGRQTGPGSHIVEGRGAGEREVEWRLGLLTRGPLSKGG